MNPKDNQVIEQVLAPLLMTNSATHSANLDIAGRGSYCTVIVQLSAETNTNAGAPDIVFSQSDDTVVTNFVTMTADLLVTDATVAKNIVYHVDLRGKKRYLHLEVQSGTTDTNDDITVSAVAILSALKKGPSSTSDMVAGGTVDIVTVL